VIAVICKGLERGLIASALILSLPLALKLGKLVGAWFFNHHGGIWLDPQ